MRQSPGSKGRTLPEYLDKSEVDALIKAAESDVSGEDFNVGSGGTYSINHLVKLLGGDVVHLPRRPGEPDCTFADIQTTIDRLGWTPQMAFEDGVAKMLKGSNKPAWRNLVDPTLTRPHARR